MKNFQNEQNEFNELTVNKVKLITLFENRLEND